MPESDTHPPVFDPPFLAKLDDLLLWRRDVRAFDTRPVDEAILNDLLDRACLSPSVGNAQPWRFVRVLTAALRQAVIDHVEEENAVAAAQYDDPAQRAAYKALKLHGLDQAPEHIAVFCDEAVTEGHGLGRRTMPETLRYSTVTAIHTLWLAARARGVGLGWVSILDPAEIVQMLAVPPAWTFIGYLCLGYPAEEQGEPELARLGWQARIDPAGTRFTR